MNAWIDFSRESKIKFKKEDCKIKLLFSSMHFSQNAPQVRFFQLENVPTKNKQIGWKKKSRFVLLLYQRGHDKAQKRDENKTLGDKELETKVE